MTNGELARAINTLRQQIINTHAVLWWMQNHEKQLVAELEERTGKPLNEVRPA